MGKQAFDRRVALANAGNTSNVPVEVKPIKKEPAPVKSAPKKKEQAPAEPPPKTKKEIEEEQKRFVEENEAKRRAFFEEEALKKVRECKAIDVSVTYVEQKDTRKPVAIDDISDYWRSNLGVMPFLPEDNVGGNATPEEGLEAGERLQYLRLLDGVLQQVLRMKFHVFWSQVIYDANLRRCLDSYLRFALRAHDVDVAAAEGSDIAKDPDEAKAAADISERMLAVFLRLSSPRESAQDFMTDVRFSQLIMELHIFDIPKLVDLCSIYGDSNRSTVTKIVHSVFRHQPRYEEEFKEVVGHVLGSFRQCCLPLQQLLAEGAVEEDEAGLSVEECLAFLPDMLSCFNAIFCFFPEDCIELLMGGSMDKGLPLADLMVILHESVSALNGQSSAGDLLTNCKTTLALLSRLLCLVLGFRHAPRKGAAAFSELLDWLKQHADHGALLNDLGKHGLENVAMDWMASGLVDDAQLDYLEELCGQLLPKEARARASSRRGKVQAAARSSATSSAATGSGAAAASSSSSKTSSSDASKIREVREVVGMEYGEGFVLQCLLHYSNSVPAVVGSILDGSLPPQLAALPHGLGLHQDPSMALSPTPDKAKLSAEDKARVLAQAERFSRDASAAAGSAASAAAGTVGPDGLTVTVVAEDYDDDFDDGDLVPGFKIGANEGSDSEKSEKNNASSSDEENAPTRKGGGKGSGKSKGPVQGQTFEARRKEENKAKVGNHNRRDRALRKMMKGM